ncbi:MAG: hypothetical protein JNK45_21195 [Myxococcales bacterium]|nr:hypothetical protein [Myxococcales bacterium]
MSWIVLVIAGLLETVWAVGLKATHGFTRPLPTLVVALAMIGSMWLLSIATRTVPVGTAYAIWVGIGVVGTAIVGIVAQGEPISWLRGLCLVGLLASIVGLELTSTVHR